MIDLAIAAKTGGIAAKALANGKLSSTGVYTDGFEAPFILPPLTGKVRFTSRPLFTTAPGGTQIESLSQKLQSETGLRFLQADTGLLGRVRPDPMVYRNRVDFDRLRYSPGGEVEARLTPVDLSLGDPAASTSGCEASDFASFPRGNIALLQRGACTFRQQAANAEAAGASAVIIFNQGTGGNQGLFLGSLEPNYGGIAPVVSVGFELGREWATSGSATFRLRVDAGLSSSAWEMVPVPGADADAAPFWIRNARTGELLVSKPSLPIFDISVSSVELDTVAPDNTAAWWRPQAIPSGSGLRNVQTNQFLAVFISGSNVRLLSMASADLPRLCPDDPCGSWALDSSILDPPPGSTRLRSALGAFYLQDGGAASAPPVPVAPIRSGWAKAQWVLEAVPNTTYRRLLNVETGHYLHVENGSLESGPASPNWYSAMWTLEPADTLAELPMPGTNDTIPLAPAITGATGYYHLRNLWTSELLRVQDGAGATGSANSGELAALWVLDDRPIILPDSNLRAIANDYLGQSAGADIRSSEAGGLYQLWGGDSGISTISGIDNFIRLRDLRLSGDNISDISPLSTLTELNYLDLSGNPLTDLDALVENEGLRDGDRVILLNGALPPSSRGMGASLLSRNVTLVPAPGYVALHRNGTTEVVDTRSGGLKFKAVDTPENPPTSNQISNHATWDIEYDAVNEYYYLINLQNGSEDFVYWDDSLDRLEFTSRGGAIGQDKAAWQFEPFQSGVYRVWSVRESGADAPVNASSRNYLQFCFGKIQLNQDNGGVPCPAVELRITSAMLQAAVDRAQAGAYNPHYAPPSAGYTRIQHIETREFVRVSGGNAVIGQAIESDTSAQWKALPIRAGEATLALLQNRQSGGFLVRNGDGLNVAAVPMLPGGGIDYSHASNYLFEMRGAGDLFTIRPEATPNLALRAAAAQLSFADGLTQRDMLWRLDGGLDYPDGFVEVQEPVSIIPGIFDYSISVSYDKPEGGGTTTHVNLPGAGYYTIPGDALNTRIVVICDDCSSDGLLIFDKTYASPPNKCFGFEQVIGRSLFRPQTCDPAMGQLENFVKNSINSLSCELVLAGRAADDIIDAIPVKKVAARLNDGDVEGASRALFSNADVDIDLSSCGSAYQTMNFGAGGSGSIIAAGGGGEVGFIWGLAGDADDVRTYSSTSVSLEGGTLLGASLDYSLGVWRVSPDNYAGRSLGLGLSGNTPISKVGLGLNLWFACNTGSAPILFSAPGLSCDVREDSTLQGFTFTGSLGFAIGAPANVNATRARTCVPADLGIAAVVCD